MVKFFTSQMPFPLPQQQHQISGCVLLGLVFLH